MTSPIRVERLHFNGGAVIDTSAADVVVLVGPNNTGKSRSLQEIHTWLSLHPGHPIPQNTFFVLDRVDMARHVDAEQMRDWLIEHRYSWADQNDLLERVRTASAGEVILRDIPFYWNEAADRLGPLAPHLVRGLWCGERLGYLGSPSRLELDAHPDHPVHWLVRDEQLMAAFRRAFRAAFGTNVIVDAWGSTIRLRLSADESQDDFQAASSDGLPAPDLVRRLAALPLVEAQSDGVRSFAGILLTLLAAQYPLVLLDEPEAFLHPPQARLLGRSLAELQRSGQLFVASHSLDILLGLIEARPERVLIVRLTRQSGRTIAQTLEPERLAELWRDPLLRFSRALDGLFHDGVVVCEGDTDSQFYSAIATEGDRDLARGRHVMFTYAGSKFRIPLVSRALEALGVPVRSVVDFDALNDRSTLSALVEGHGHEYTPDSKQTAH